MSGEQEAAIKDKYVITLRPSVKLEEHTSFVQSLLGNDTTEGISFSGLLDHLKIGSFRGYVGHFPPNVISKIRQDKDVERVEKDRLLFLPAVTTQTGPDYGLNLISHRGLSQQEKGYTYDKIAGKGSYVYVLDSGIDVAHLDFNERAVFGYNSVKGGIHDEDLFGHGTHVAGIIGGATFGVAKQCELISVKVLRGSWGTLTELMIGYDWTAKDIVFHKRQRKAVVNISLAMERSLSLNKAIQAAMKMGVVTVVSAGDDNADVIGVSPASAGAITVAATNHYRIRAKMSNHGRAVTLFAPGVDIRSTWPQLYPYEGPNNANKTQSGTSMAAAFVSGIVAYLYSIRGFSDPDSVKKILVRLATPGVVGEAMDSPNLFAYNGGGTRFVLDV